MLNAKRIPITDQPEHHIPRLQGHRGLQFLQLSSQRVVLQDFQQFSLLVTLQRCILPIAPLLQQHINPVVHLQNIHPGAQLLQLQQLVLLSLPLHQHKECIIIIQDYGRLYIVVVRDVNTDIISESCFDFFVFLSYIVKMISSGIQIENIFVKENQF